MLVPTCKITIGTWSLQWYLFRQDKIKIYHGCCRHDEKRQISFTTSFQREMTHCSFRKATSTLNISKIGK